MADALKFKICMLGAYKVGKTSLVQKYIKSIFSEKYHATIGVKIDKKVVLIGEREITLMLWDVGGPEEHFSAPPSYFSKANGYLLVVDTTRPETVDKALELAESVNAVLASSPPVPVIVLNKCDLPNQLDAAAMEKLKTLNCPVIHGSAKTGQGVEEAFMELARRIVAG